MITARFDDVRQLLREQGEALGMSVETTYDRDRFLLLTNWLKGNVGGTLLLSGTFRETSPDRRQFDVTGEPLLVEGLTADGQQVIVTDEESDVTFIIQPVMNAGVNFYLRR